MTTQISLTLEPEEQLTLIAEATEAPKKRCWSCTRPFAEYTDILGRKPDICLHCVHGDSE